MVDVSYVVVFAVVISFLVLFVVIIMLIRTTRKVVDNTNILLKREADAAAASPVDMIKQDPGFRTHRTFQTIFKTRLGVSPSEYRSTVRNN